MPKTWVAFQWLVWIVTRGARDSAFDVTSTLSQTVHMMIDLETVVAFAAGFVDVDVQHVIAQCLSGAK